MGYIRRQLATRRGRRIAGTIGLIVLAWIVVRCSSTALKPPALVFIPSGSTTEILRALQAQNIPVNPEEPPAVLRGKTIAPGWIRFNPYLSITPEAFFARLIQSSREPTRRVVMYSGDTIQNFAHQLASQTLLPEGKLLNAYYRYSPYSDGGILAGHYAIPYRTIPSATLYAMVAQSEHAFRRAVEHAGMHYDPAAFKHALILASIIQKETWHTEEMPRIASVIANRLRRHMKLQLDATLNYGPYAHTPVTPERIRTDVSRYNTYRHYGLPPEPIGSVTLAALSAALHPAKTPYLFFVRNIQGTHNFATTYAAHRANIARIQAEKEHADANQTIPSM